MRAAVPGEIIPAKRRGVAARSKRDRRLRGAGLILLHAHALPMTLLSPSLSSARSGGEGVRRTGEEAARFMGARREEIRGSLCWKLCRKLCRLGSAQGDAQMTFLGRIVAMLGAFQALA